MLIPDYKYNLSLSFQVKAFYFMFYVFPKGSILQGQQCCHYFAQ